MAANAGDPNLLDTRGHASYGGGHSDFGQDWAKQWYVPSNTLGGRTIVVLADTPTPLSADWPPRKFVMVRNRSATVTLWIGDSSVAVNLGWDLAPGEMIKLDQREFVGELWGITAPGSAALDVTVLDPGTTPL